MAKLINNSFRNKLGKTLLTFGGSVNIFVAILHILIALIGVSAYQYFGAPAVLIQLVQNNNSLLVVGIMGMITFAFALVGLYGLSGAGLLRRLPGLNLVLIAIGLIYLIRGAAVLLILFPEITKSLMQTYPNILGMGRPIMYQDWLFSFVCLFLGLTYLLGWKFVAKK